MRYVSRQNLYNPHEQTPQELITSFVVRMPLFKRLYQEITDWEDTIQHYLLQGKRGMGKTSLLLRLCYEIDAQKPANIIGLPFKEEAFWRINRLDVLWEETARLLGEKDMRFVGLENEMKNTYSEKLGIEHYEKACFELLHQALTAHNQHIILFIDNLGELFQNFKIKEVQRLREILLTSRRLRLVGGTSVLAEFFFDYEHPFYEFFKVITLKSLDSEETIALMRSLGEIEGKSKEIENIIQHQRARLETMRTLTGGVTRTLVLLFDILLQDAEGKALLDLERVLDEVTPLYQDRLNRLTPMQKTIIDKIAFSWDAISIEDLATQLRENQAELLPALQELTKMDIIERVEAPTDTNLYLLQERFFNIWYLMRMSSSKTSNKVVWLVQFMNAWYENQDQLGERLAQHLNVLSEGKYLPKHAVFYYEAFMQLDLMDSDTEDKLKQQTITFLEKKAPQYIRELSETDSELWVEGFEHINRFLENKEYEIKHIEYALECLLKVKKKNSLAEFGLGACYENLEILEDAVRHYKNAYEYGMNEAIESIASVLYKLKDYENAKYYYNLAFEKGYNKFHIEMAHIYKEERDFESMEKYLRKAIENKNTNAKPILAAQLLLIDKTRIAEARELVEEGCEESNSNLSKLILACIYIVLKLYEDADKLFYGISHFYLSTQFVDTYKIYIKFLLSHNQYSYAQAHFERENGILKEKLKPLYYAFLKLSGSPDYLKMPPEIGEVVEGIIAEIEKMREEYSKE